MLLDTLRGDASPLHGMQLDPNFVIAASYFTLPICLAILGSRLSRRNMPQGRVLDIAMFVTFILFCGIGHLHEWQIGSAHDVGWHWATASISAATALRFTYLTWEECLGKRTGVASVLDGWINADHRQQLQDEKLWRQFLTSCPFAIALVDPSGKFIETSPAFPRLVGYTPTEFLNLSYQEITHPADLAPDLEQHAALLRGDIYSYSMRKRYVRRDGSLIWVLLEAGLVKDLDLAISYVTDISEQVREGQSIEFDNSVKSALLNHKFELYYQPVVQLESGRIEGFEALIRWPQSDGSILTPGQFLDQVDQATMPALCFEVIEIACEAIRQFPEYLWVAVNLSPLTLQQGGFEHRLEQIRQKAGVPQQRLRFEITEEDLRDEPVLASVMRNLKAEGYTLELDDYFRGYSNFSTLATFPIDVIKIDKSVTDRIGTPVGEQAIAFALRLAELMKLEVIVEGIEESFQAEWLLQSGCSFGQGYLFGKPMPLADALAVVKADE